MECQIIYIHLKTLKSLLKYQALITDQLLISETLTCLSGAASVRWIELFHCD